MSRWERLSWRVIGALLLLQAFLTMLAVEKAAVAVVKAIEPYSNP